MIAQKIQAEPRKGRFPGERTIIRPHAECEIVRQQETTMNLAPADERVDSDMLTRGCTVVTRDVYLNQLQYARCVL